MAGVSSTRFSSEAHLRIGRWLRSKWHLDSLIAIGGMASVYAGTHRNGARAAIKVLHAQYTRNEQARRRFLAEGYAANKVGHRNAVSVLDDDTTEDGEVYLVMELLEGESFEGRLERVGVMNPIEVLEIAEQMLEVLACAHNRGILHRDIKPANVFLCRDGSVKILDFGLARVRELSAEALDQSDGIVFGTVSYIAPEQARADNQNLDARSDMWSVAATMFRALTGETVFPAEGPVIERLMAVARKPARSLAWVNPRLPRLVIELVDRALAFNPEDRWPSANVMRVVIQDVLAQLNEEAEAAEAARLAAASDEDEVDLALQSPVFRTDGPAPTRPRTRTDPQVSSPAPTRPKTDPPPAQQPAPTLPKTDPQASKPNDASASGRRRIDPVLAQPEPRASEPSPSPMPFGEGNPDEIDLDVEGMQQRPREGKRGRTRTLLTKEGRAELRRILDARRVPLGIPGAKADPTPEPVAVESPAKEPRPTSPAPTPTPPAAAEPSPVGAVQPVPRVKTEPSPAATVQPRPRVTTEPSPVAAPVQPVDANESGVFLGADLVVEDPSMLASGLVVLQPEESIIEVTIQHTRPEPSGTIAEPLADTVRPGPSDSMTNVAFPSIGGVPRTAGPPVVRPPGVAISPGSEDRSSAPAPETKTTAAYPTIGGVPPAPVRDDRVGDRPESAAKPTASYPAIGAPVPGDSRAKPTASYPAIASPPAKPTPSTPPPPAKGGTASYPAVGASKPRDEVTRIGAAPLGPGARPAAEGAKAVPVAPAGSLRPSTVDVAKPSTSTPTPTPTRSEEVTKIGPVPVAPPGTVRPEEPAGEVTKVAKIPLPTFGRPGAPGGATPGPLPSRTPGEARPPQASVSGEIGDDRRPPGTGAPSRWAPPTKPAGEAGPPTKPAGEVGQPAPLPTQPARVSRPEPTPAPESAVKPAEPAKPASVSLSETLRPNTMRAPVTRPPAPATKPEAPAKSASPPATEPEVVKPASAKPASAGARPEGVKPASATTKPIVEARPASTSGIVERPVAKAGEPMTRPPTRPEASAAKPTVAKPEAGAASPTKPVAAKPAEVRPGKPVEPAPAKVVEAAKPEDVKPEASTPSQPEPTPVPGGEVTPDPLRLPGAGLSRPAPTKSLFSVPYANLGKAPLESKPPAKTEPATKPEEPARGTPPKKSS